MLPSKLSPPPPRGFKAPGRILEVYRHKAPPPFIIEERKKRKRGRKAQGIKYELKAHAEFASRYGKTYEPGPWFSFTTNEGHRWCQPDALIVSPDRRHLTIIEYKYQHTFDAWYQLFRLYLPVVQAYYGPDAMIACCEVVKWFDPAVYCDPRPVLMKDPLDTPINTFGVHIFAP